MRIDKIELSGSLLISSSLSRSPLRINDNYLYINPQGNIGIGSDSPTKKLVVTGSVSVRGDLKATTLSGSFTGSIKLPTIPLGTSETNIVLVKNTGDLVYRSNLSLTGAQGNQGFQGIQGTTGAQGFQGNQGAQGVQGTNGTVGTQGFQGNQGPTGLQGTTGAQGNQGIQGTTGTQGFQGNQGPQGNQGIQGTNGTVGVNGAQGNQGPQGNQGIQGTTGTQGFQGNQGPQGNTGAQGNQGPTGIQGTTGSQGNQGPTGLQGTTGAQGLTGATGGTGTQGFQGRQGPTGPSDTTDFLNKVGQTYYQVNTWLQLNGVYGLYAPGTNGAHLYPNTTYTYTTWHILGNRNSYGGITDGYSAVSAIMYDSAGNGGIYREANGRWYLYHLVANNCMGVGTSTTNSSYGIYVTKGGYFDGRVDGTIFYDANNTAYYVDPASTSNLNAVTCVSLTETSTLRIKENIEGIENPLEIIRKLRGVQYNKKGNNNKEIGVIAEEVVEILPQVVLKDYLGNATSVSYGRLTALLIEVVKKQDEELISLRKEVEYLKENIDKIFTILNSK